MKTAIKITLTILFVAATAFTIYFAEHRWSLYSKYSQPFDEFAEKAERGEEGYETIQLLSDSGRKLLFQIMASDNGKNKSLAIYGALSAALLITSLVLLWRGRSFPLKCTLGGMLALHVWVCVSVDGGGAEEIATILAIPVVLLAFAFLFGRLQSKTAESGAGLGERQAA